MPDHTWTITFTTERDRAGVLRRIAKAGMNLATITVDGEEITTPWAVACKHCYAEPGEPCLTKLGAEYRWGFVHDCRVQAVDDAE